MITPKKLKPGDSIAIVAPSGVVEKEDVLKNINILQEWGLNPVLGKNIFNRWGPFAGNDKERAQDLQLALDNPSIHAILCARGGYGVTRILDNINFKKFTATPKWIIGFSDITALHCHINANYKIETIHGPVAINLLFSQHASDALKNILFNNTIHYPLKPSRFNKPGRIKGILIGGNLTTIMNLLGSNSIPELEGNILFIEDIGEYLYHLDRMIQTLKRAGWFEKINGLLVGQFTNMKEGRIPINKNANEIISEALEGFEFPIAYDFPAGHIKANTPLILGRNIDLCIENETVHASYLG